MLATLVTRARCRGGPAQPRLPAIRPRAARRQAKRVRPRRKLRPVRTPAYVPHRRWRGAARFPRPQRQARRLWAWRSRRPVRRPSTTASLNSRGRSRRDTARANRHSRCLSRNFTTAEPLEQWPVQLPPRSTSRQRAGIAFTPNRIPARPPATHAVVSVSWRARRRCARHLRSSASSRTGAAPTERVDDVAAPDRAARRPEARIPSSSREHASPASPAFAPTCARQS